MSNSSIWLLDSTLSGATTPGQSGPGSNDNESVLYIHPDSLVNHPDALFFQYGINLLIDGNGLGIVIIHVVLQETPEIKIWELQIR